MGVVSYLTYVDNCPLAPHPSYADIVHTIFFPSNNTELGKKNNEFQVKQEFFFSLQCREEASQASSEESSVAARLELPTSSAVLNSHSIQDRLVVPGHSEEDYTSPNSAGPQRRRIAHKPCSSLPNGSKTIANGTGREDVGENATNRRQQIPVQKSTGRGKRSRTKRRRAKKKRRRSNSTKRRIRRKTVKSGQYRVREMAAGAAAAVAAMGNGIRSRARTAATHITRLNAMRQAVRESYRHDNEAEGLERARVILAKSTPRRSDFVQHFPTPSSGYEERRRSRTRNDNVPHASPPTDCRMYGFTPSRNHRIHPPALSATAPPLPRNHALFSDTSLSEPNMDEMSMKARRLKEASRRVSKNHRRALPRVLITPVKLYPNSSGSEVVQASGNSASGDSVSGGSSNLDILEHMCRGLDKLDSRQSIIERDGRIMACGMCICVDGGVDIIERDGRIMACGIIERDGRIMACGIIERDGRIMACGIYICMCGWGCRYH